MTTSCADERREIRYCLLFNFCYVTLISIVVLIGCFVTPLLDFLISGPSLTFTLNEVTLYTFNISTTTSTVTSDLQINVTILNSDVYNDYHFDDINVYACYKSYKITLPTMVPPMDLEAQFRSGNSASYPQLNPPLVTVWSLYLNGTGVPVTPYLAASFVQNRTAGNVGIDVKVTGNLTSEYGSLSRRFWVKVSCPVDIMFRNRNDGNVVGVALKGSFGGVCNVEV